MGPQPSAQRPGNLLWRVGFLSIITCTVVTRMGSDELVGQLFGLAGVSCCVAAYHRTWGTTRGVRDRAPSDALERTIQMGVLNAIDPPSKRRSA